MWAPAENPSAQAENVASALHGLKPLPLSPSEFQRLQAGLTQYKIAYLSPMDCSRDDVLREILTVLDIAVVAERHTSWSRTQWLSGRYGDSCLLLVVDASTFNDKARVCIDAWTASEEMQDALLVALGETRLASVASPLHKMKVAWNVSMCTETLASLLVDLEVGSLELEEMPERVFFVIESQGIKTDLYEAEFAAGERVSVALEPQRAPLDSAIVLDDPFLQVTITDAEWKPLPRGARFLVTWRDALQQQITAQLAQGRRFSGFAELADAFGLHMSEDVTTVKRLFLDLCLERQPEKCTRQRATDHCKRATIISGLVVCFNPARGLSGYLQMISEPDTPDRVVRLGSERTWKEQITETAHIAEEFTAASAVPNRRKRESRRGRPPIHLHPSTPLTELFHRLMGTPEKVVCRNCRFMHTEP